MRYSANERGVALVMALVLAVIALAIVSALVFLATQGSMLSGFQKRYQTAHEAAGGGVEFMTKEIIARTLPATTYYPDLTPLTTSISSLQNDYSLISLALRSATTSAACLRDKLVVTRIVTQSGTTTDYWTNCGADSKSLELKKPDGTVISDWSFELSGVAPAPSFNVFVKIVDTVAGNTDTGGLALQGMGVVEAGSGLVSPAPEAYLYRLEVQSERKDNPDERANFSVLYAY
ncbi:MAG: pilus assembly PilX N-terminal domain-containing protein [Nitrospirae bacterium]|nr:pilus assembly PilX N-terminal domain-containing protein [Nitrospirota bacterium]